MGGEGQIHWYSFRRHKSHAICLGFARWFDLLPPEYSTNMPTSQLSEKMIYHSNNHNAYNEVTQITHLNFNGGMLGVSSYL